MKESPLHLILTFALAALVIIASTVLLGLSRITPADWNQQMLMAMAAAGLLLAPSPLQNRQSGSLVPASSSTIAPRPPTG